MSLITRGFAAVVLAAALTGLMAPPTSAGQTAAPTVAVFLPDVLVDFESSGTLVNVVVGASESVELENFVLKVDFAGLAGVATVTPTATGCDVVAEAVVCNLGTVDLEMGVPLDTVLAVAPATIAIVGATGKWKATISANGLQPTSMESSVTLAEGVDLGAPRGEVTVTGSPASSIQTPMEVNNVGEKAADGAVAWIVSDYPVIAAKQFSNCTFRGDQMTSCSFDEQLAPGAGYSTEESLFKLRADTFAPSRASFEVHWMTKAEFELLKKTFEPGFLGSPGTGDKLRLEQKPNLRTTAVQTDIDDTNNTTFIHINVEGDNGADLAAIGDTASGAAGQVVTVTVGLHNVGPATIDFTRSDDPAAVIDITLPWGSSLAEMPARCVSMRQVGDAPQNDPDPGSLLARFLRCTNQSRIFKAGTDWSFPVKLRIDQVIAGAAGVVAVATECSSICRPDKSPANDTANIVLNAALPTTGVQTGLIAGGGALLALAGVGAFMLGRRRKSSTGQ